MLAYFAAAERAEQRNSVGALVEPTTETVFVQCARLSSAVVLLLPRRGEN